MTVVIMFTNNSRVMIRECSALASRVDEIRRDTRQCTTSYEGIVREKKHVVNFINVRVVIHTL